MDTDAMRVMCDEWLAKVVTDYLRAIEQDDLAALKRLLHLDVVLTHANFPPVQGRQSTLDIMRAYSQLIERTEFVVRTLVGGDGLVLAEWVNVLTLVRGSMTRIPQATALEVDGEGRITAIRIYADIADLFISIRKRSEALAPDPRRGTA